MSGGRLAFELDHELETSSFTAHAGVPLLIEHFRSCGAAAVVDSQSELKRRARGLSASEMVESLLALWACGGEPAEDLDRLREEPGLALLLGHQLPAAQTARDFLARFEAPDLPLLSAPGQRGVVRQESAGLTGLWQANRAILADVQARARQRVATLDIDATVLASSKRAAKATYDGQRGYQPSVALWAEQDLILAEEFRDGNVSPSSGNDRLIARALAALPAGIEEVYLRADSALYNHKLMVGLEQRKVGFAISVPIAEAVGARIRALPEQAWRFARQDQGAVRHWAELDYLPEAAISQKEGVVRRLRYIAIRITKAQGELFADGGHVKHFCVVTNRKDPEGGSAADILAWHRAKAGTIEHCHHVMTNELAAEALPSQKFGANAAWFRINAMLYNLLSAFKRIALPEEFHAIRPKRLRFLVLNTLAKVVSHARERLLRCSTSFARRALDTFRVRIHATCPT